MTRVDRLAAYFTAWPDRWIDARELLTIAGTFAWRTRISDLRTQRGWNIQNRQRRVKIQYGGTGETITISEYRYVPRTEPQAQSLFDVVTVSWPVTNDTEPDSKSRTIARG